MTSRLDLADAAIADLVVQAPPPVVALRLILLDSLVQQEQPSAWQAPPLAALPARIQNLDDRQSCTAHASPQPSAPAVAA